MLAQTIPAPSTQPVAKAPSQAPDEFADEQMSSDEPPEGFEPPPPEDDEEYSYGNDDYSESNDFDYQ
jgi:DNA primase